MSEQISDHTRRTFFSLGGAALAASATQLRAADDKVNVAVIGLGGRGRAHMNEYSKLPDARILAVCDVDQAALERGQAQVEKATGTKPKGYSDMRKVFDDKEIQAVSMPLPNHWHALATIWAVQAGKDVYVEKPACYNPFEGTQMIAAARKYNRMVQIGSQSRSMEHKIKAMQLLKDGAIGKVYLAKGLCFKRRPSIGHKPDSPVPPGVDWSMFLGPAPMRPFNELRFKYNWHWFWDTGNGDIGNQGVHEMDIARWGLGVQNLPAAVSSTGGKYVYDDDQETPNTQMATFDYGDKELMFEVRGLPTGPEGGLQIRGGNTVGNLFYGSDGWMAVDGAGFQVYKGDKNEKTMDEKNTGMGDTGPHMANFLAAVKSRDMKDLHADVQIGVLSADLCHLANISYRLKRNLKFDDATQKFVNDNEANALLTRKYRAPYIVPAKV
ncbi:MAG: Gfo/Idh/MocA family oxidoreductase [Acidobacteriota bacterium]|nr:Gfo/Idh/MocA family oxidoreductase [Acidobacteriota bacterium]